MELEPRGTRPMAWISEVSNGGEQRSAQRIRCDLCSWETEEAYWGPTDARVGAGVYWPKKDEHQGEGEPAWCPRCASRPVTNLQVEAVMKWYWRAPTKAPPPGTSHRKHIQTASRRKHPRQPGTSSQAHPGRVLPKAPTPGTSSQAHLEERLAALEEEMIRLRLRVAELEQHSSAGAATG